MTQDISGFGLRVRLIASNTYPAGIDLTQFADDSDPLDFASVTIADSAMGLNGDLITWSKAVALPAVLTVIPGSDDDQALEILANNNRVGKGKALALDLITITAVYPDGSSKTVTNGKMTAAMFGKSVSSSGRMKTKVYGFSFENAIG